MCLHKLSFRNNHVPAILEFENKYAFDLFASKKQFIGLNQLIRRRIRFTIQYQISTSLSWRIGPAHYCTGELDHVIDFGSIFAGRFKFHQGTHRNTHHQNYLPDQQRKFDFIWPTGGNTPIYFAWFHQEMELVAIRVSCASQGGGVGGQRQRQKIITQDR